MTKQYNKIGVTTGGYRGNRAILEQRVIEGFEESKFDDGVLQLNPESPETIYLTGNNMAEGYFIVLPNAKDLWANWRVSIINDSTKSVKIYYYTEDLTELNLFKEVSGGNMSTLILLDDTTTEGRWTTLRTMETLNAEQVEKYTSNILDTIEINWNQIQGNTSPIVFYLTEILPGTAVKSVYLKTEEPFVFDDSDSDNTHDLKISIGMGMDESDEDYVEDHFIKDYDLTNPVSETNFTKDLFDEILSTNNTKYVCATVTGTDFSSLTSGKLIVTIERAKLIDPTVLRNPIIQTNLPIGTVMNYIFSDAPDGFLRLNGAVYPNANASFPQFVEKLNAINNKLVGEKLIVGIDEWNQIYNTNGSCGKFAWQGSGLKFPAINCFIQGMTDLTQLAKLTPAGLPNIVGEFTAQQSMSAIHYSGAFTEYGGNGRVDSSTSGARYANNFDFDASRCSPVYGNSDTVTPTNIKYPYIISVYNKIQNASVVDFNALLEDSVYKLNTNFDNVEVLNNWDSNYKNNLVSLALPDYESAISSTSPYTAPKDGWILWTVNTGQGPEYLYLNEVQVAWVAALAGSDNVGYTATIPVRKNDIITWTVGSCIFYPCKGAI